MRSRLWKTRKGIQAPAGDCRTPALPYETSPQLCSDCHRELIIQRSPGQSITSVFYGAAALPPIPATTAPPSHHSYVEKIKEFLQTLPAYVLGEPMCIFPRRTRINICPVSDVFGCELRGIRAEQWPGDLGSLMMPQPEPRGWLHQHQVTGGLSESLFFYNSVASTSSSTHFHGCINTVQIVSMVNTNTKFTNEDVPSFGKPLIGPHERESPSPWLKLFPAGGTFCKHPCGTI